NPRSYFFYSFPSRRSSDLYILSRHLIANTEFSYLAFPDNYNRLFIPRPRTKAGNGFKTLNSKAVGRLLAAGGIYNGNIEGFRETDRKSTRLNSSHVSISYA